MLLSPLIIICGGPCEVGESSSVAPTPRPHRPYATFMERNSDGGAGEKAALSPDLSERLCSERINSRVKPALGYGRSRFVCSIVFASWLAQDVIPC